MKIVILDFTLKVIGYVLLYGGIKTLELDKLIVALTNVLTAISKTI